MRKLLISIMLMASACIAGENAAKVIASGVNDSTTVTNTTTALLTGQLESIFVDVTAPATNIVTISGKEGTIFTSAAITADTVLRPVFAVVDVSGAGIADVYAKHMLVMEPLTVVVSGTDTNANDCAVTIKTR